MKLLLLALAAPALALKVRATILGYTHNLAIFLVI